MAFNGSGSYSPPAASFPAVAQTIIESTKYNAVINDIATALSTCITKDGQTTTTAAIPFATLINANNGLTIATSKTLTATSGTANFTSSTVNLTTATISGQPTWSSGQTFPTVTSAGLVTANGGVTVASGQTVTINGVALSGLPTSMGWQKTIRKTADESVSTSTVLQDDDHLTFPIAANEEWVVSYFIDSGAGLTTTGCSTSISAPAGATVNLYRSDSAAFSFQGMRSAVLGSTQTLTAAAYGSADTNFIQIHFWILNGANAGNVTLQWTQQTSSATQLTFRKGSYLKAVRIA